MMSGTNTEAIIDSENEQFYRDGELSVSFEELVEFISNKQQEGDLE